MVPAAWGADGRAAGTRRCGQGPAAGAFDFRMPRSPHSPRGRSAAGGRLHPAAGGRPTVSLVPTSTPPAPFFFSARRSIPPRTRRATSASRCMPTTMEAAVAEKSGTSPKLLEARVSVHAEAQDRLFDAFPRRRGENLKAWFPRVARELNGMARSAGWAGVHITPRRVRALWNLEARRIDAVEIRLFELAERMLRLEHNAEDARGELNGIHRTVAALRSTGASGDPARGSRAPAEAGGRGESGGETGTADRRPAGGATEELTLALPALKFSPRLFSAAVH